MYKKIIFPLNILIILLFFTFVAFFYFSDENKKKIKNNRANYFETIEAKIKELPFVESDTKNVIIYNQEIQNNNKVKNRYFWNLLKKDE